MFVCCFHLTIRIAIRIVSYTLYRDAYRIVSVLEFELSPNENKFKEFEIPSERKMEAKGQLDHSSKESEVIDGPSLEHEVARRELERVPDELNMYLHAKLTQIQKKVSDPNLVKEVNNIIEISGDIYKKLKSDQNKFANAVDGAGEWRKRENLRLTDLVQRRLEYVQASSESSGL
ncbi:hypothetical protein DPMN_007828 [Dreissena polymorpha]|uniref:Alpha-(1,6)-fucosyltransferase N- and catalytic domain-containing protein n=1 Tax=Dreissena polymorpha TaxID=45954 RepID=A0A9D4RYL0_DREPO|nr:hypothetical protein DPMN_007828 [Dreissena polymorpha]